MATSGATRNRTLPLVGGLRGTHHPWQRAIALLILITAGVAIALVIRSQMATRAAPAYTTITLRRGTIERAITASGTIAAAQVANVSGTAGATITEIDVKPGDAVTAGQVIGRLTSPNLVASLTQAQAGLDTATANLTQAQQPNTPADIAGQQAAVTSAANDLYKAQNPFSASDLASAQAAVTQAQSAIQQLVAPATQASDIASAQQAMTQAQSQLDALEHPATQASDIASAKSAYAQAQLTFNQTVHPSPTAQSDIEAARASVAQAQSALQQLVSPATQASDVASAQAAVAQAQSAMQQLVAPTTQASDIAAAQATVAQAQAALAQTTSPTSGTGSSQSATSSSSGSGGANSIGVSIPMNISASSSTSASSAAALSAASNLGAALAKLQNALVGPSPAAVQAAQSNLSAAQAKLQSVQAGASPAAVAAQQEALNAAQLKLQSLTVTPDPLSVQGAQASVEAAQAKLNSVLQGPTAISDQAARQAVSAAQVKLQSVLAGPSQASVQAANDALMAARLKLSQEQLGVADPGHAMALNAAQATYASSQQKLAQMQAGGTPQAVQVAQANLKTAQGALQLATDQMQLTAPIAGTVLAVNNSAGDTVGVSTSAASTGSNLGTTVFQIGSLSNQLVQISVNQLDAPSVRVGQQATLQFDAFPGQRFRGSVIVVTPQATTTSGVVNFPVTVAVINPPPTLQPGMTATVNVITFQKPNVLTLPRAAVTTRNGVSTVQVPDANGKVRQVTVTTGVSDAPGGRCATRRDARGRRPSGLHRRRPRRPAARRAIANIACSRLPTGNVGAIRAAVQGRVLNAPLRARPAAVVPVGCARNSVTTCRLVEE
jgi:HlyD family secretion protein